MCKELISISPIDGRYFDKVKELSEYFSEYALIKKRIFVELEYLKELGKGDFTKIFDDFDLKEAKTVKKIEHTINHDVKAVEYYIKDKVPEEVKEFVHFGLTSEDVNNLAYSLLIKGFLENVFYGKISELLKRLEFLSKQNKEVVMLARTHGQPASPTTLGKEFFVFFKRLKEQYIKLQLKKLKGKLNGATGNYNALYFAQPDKDWLSFSRDFISKLGLQPNLVTTQIEPKDSLVELFQVVKRINNIILNLDKDMWLYIALDYFNLVKKEDEVGSSTMPHKINPIDFENSEGNIKIANSLFTSFESLQISRLQRDLSDSTVMRNIGTAFAHSVLAYDSALKGLHKITPNIKKINEDLEKHPEVLTEAIQVFLKKINKKDAYEKLKGFSRGKKISLKKLHDFIDKLDIDKKSKDKLKKLKVNDYIGLAKLIVD